MKKRNFKNQCRDHQSKFRSEVLKVGYENLHNILNDEDGKRGLNFYRSEGFDIFYSIRLPFRKPLFCNLLRSEHIPFNLFIPLSWEKEFAKRVFNEVLGGYIDQIDQIVIEYSPKPRENYLDDNTSFDTYIEYLHIDGTIGILGIEVKYTEGSYPYSGKTEKEKMESPESHYYQRSNESGVFLNLIDLKNDNYRQLWRNHLLGESILLADKSKYNHFHSLTFYPSGNTHFTKVITEYNKFLKPEYGERVKGVTYERFFQACQNHLPNEDFSKWLDWLEKRYLVTQY